LKLNTEEPSSKTKNVLDLIENKYCEKKVKRIFIEIIKIFWNLMLISIEAFFVSMYLLYNGLASLLK